MATNLLIPAPKRIQFEFGESIDIIVGASGHKFSVHKEVIIAHSAFFRAATNSDAWIEGKERVVHLPNVDPKIFAAYIQWAYSGEVLVAENREENQGVTYRDTLVELYLLGDYLRDALLRNTIVNLIISSMKKVSGSFGTKAQIPAETGLSGSAIVDIWGKTAPFCKLRQLVLDWHVICCDAKWLEQHQGCVDQDFYTDLAIAFAKANLWNRSHWTDPEGRHAFLHQKKLCKYHDHDEDIPHCHRVSDPVLTSDDEVR